MESMKDNENLQNLFNKELALYYFLLEVESFSTSLTIVNDYLDLMKGLVAARKVEIGKASDLRQIHSLHNSDVNKGVVGSCKFILEKLIHTLSKLNNMTTRIKDAIKNCEDWS